MRRVLTGLRRSRLYWSSRRAIRPESRLNFPSDSIAQCAADPRQFIAVSGVTTRHGLKFVSVCWGHRGDDEDIDGLVLVTPNDARVFAAAVLNASDDLDGTTRLHFAPASA